MMEIKVLDSEVLTLQDGERVLSVHFNVLEDGEITSELRHGFPVTTSPEDVQAELGKVLVEKKFAEEQAELNKERELENKNVENISTLLNDPITL